MLNHWNSEFYDVHAVDTFERKFHEILHMQLLSINGKERVKSRGPLVEPVLATMELNVAESTQFY